MPCRPAASFAQPLILFVAIKNTALTFSSRPMSNRGDGPTRLFPFDLSPFGIRPFGLSRFLASGVLILLVKDSGLFRGPSAPVEVSQMGRGQQDGA